MPIHDNFITLFMTAFDAQRDYLALPNTTSCVGFRDLSCIKSMLSKSAI